MSYEIRYSMLEREKNELETYINWIENNGLQCELKYRNRYLQMSKRVKEIEEEQNLL